MAFMSDTMLIASAFSLTIYCVILSRRLKRFGNLEGDIGRVITGLSAQIDALMLSIEVANETGKKSVTTIKTETRKAEAAARHLELLIASLHTLPENTKPKMDNPFFARQQSRKIVQ
jgi:hypothetical protein